MNILKWLNPRGWHIRMILDEIDVRDPKHCHESNAFIKNVRHMHKFKFALNFISSYGLVTKLYAEQMVAQKLITPEIEKIYIEQKDTHLMYYINDAGHIWSIEAKQLMRDHRPLAYKHFFQN